MRTMVLIKRMENGDSLLKSYLDAGERVHHQQTFTGESGQTCRIEVQLLLICRSRHNSDKILDPENACLTIFFCEGFSFVRDYLKPCVIVRRRIITESVDIGAMWFCILRIPRSKIIYGIHLKTFVPFHTI